MTLAKKPSLSGLVRPPFSASAAWVKVWAEADGSYAVHVDPKSLVKQGQTVGLLPRRCGASTSVLQVHNVELVVLWFL